VWEEKKIFFTPKRRGGGGGGGGVNITMDLQEVELGGKLDLSGSGYGQVAGTCKCGNELPVSRKYGEFLDQMKTG